jgi:NMD protein affecting ribosome stability and mRNA decay
MPQSNQLDTARVLTNFRAAAVTAGIITTAQMDAVRLELVSGERIEQLVQHEVHVERCACPGCQRSQEFFALIIDEEQVSRVQIRLLAKLFNFQLQKGELK